MTTKIAPNLQALSRAKWSGLYLPRTKGLTGKAYADEEAAAWDAATAELRALLAVAKSARELSDYVGEEGCACGNPGCTSVRDMKRRAVQNLARLKRVSGSRGSRHGGRRG